jgi:hypothetical protein
MCLPAIKQRQGGVAKIKGCLAHGFGGHQRQGLERSALPRAKKRNDEVREKKRAHVFDGMEEMRITRTSEPELHHRHPDPLG